jgi:hypothetical protein
MVEQGLIGLARGIKPRNSHSTFMKMNPIWSFYVKQVLSFPFVINTYWFPPLLLVQVNMAFFTGTAHETLGKRPPTRMIDFTNLVLRSFNPHGAV